MLSKKRKASGDERPSKQDEHAAQPADLLIPPEVCKNCCIVFLLEQGFSEVAAASVQ